MGWWSYVCGAGSCWGRKGTRPVPGSLRGGGAEGAVRCRPAPYEGSVPEATWGPGGGSDLLAVMYSEGPEHGRRACPADQRSGDVPGPFACLVWPNSPS